MTGETVFEFSGPVRPEGRLIGRADSIAALEGQVVDRRQHTLMLAPRRMGKTSIAMAALDRARARDGWALHVDLSRGLSSSDELAVRIAEQARAAGIRLESRATGLLQRGRKVLDAVSGDGAKRAAEVLGVEQVADGQQLATTVDEMLAPPEGPPDLRAVLNAIAAASLATGRPVVLFVDEVQRLATDWGDEDDGQRAQEALAEAMRTTGGLVLLMAGSEESAVNELFAVGEPLHHDGLWFPVGPIEDADWHTSLPGRFAEIGVEAKKEHIDAVLAESGGHPQRTMRVCAHIEQLVAGDPPRRLSTFVIDQAIIAAQKHPSWRD